MFKEFMAFCLKMVCFYVIYFDDAKLCLLLTDKKNIPINRRFCKLKRRNHALQRFLRLLIPQRSNFGAIEFNTTLFVFLGFTSKELF